MAYVDKSKSNHAGFQAIKPIVITFGGGGSEKSFFSEITEANRNRSGPNLVHVHSSMCYNCCCNRSMGDKRGLRSVPRSRVFVRRTRWHFVKFSVNGRFVTNLATIRESMFPRSLETHQKVFSKIFSFGVICPIPQKTHN